jgi:hypothetical protein
MNEKKKIEISWIPINDYFEQWNFLGSNSAYRIAEQIGSVDYLTDIKENLPDYGLIQKYHERVILISLGALFEYALKRISQIRLDRAKENEPIISTFNIEKQERKLNEEGMEATISRLNKANLIDENWAEFLNKLRVLRDEVHMDRERDENIQKWIAEIGVEGIKLRIEDFRDLAKEIIDK